MASEGAGARWRAGRVWWPLPVDSLDFLVSLKDGNPGNPLWEMSLSPGRPTPGRQVLRLLGASVPDNHWGDRKESPRWLLQAPLNSPVPDPDNAL